MRYKLSEICDVRDGTHDSPKYVMDGYPLVTSKNIVNGKLDLAVVNYISEEDYNKINERSKVDIGDIIMPMIGTIGNPYLVDEQPNYAIKNVALIKFPNENIINKYVWYYLKCPAFFRYVAEKNKGGTQKFLSLGDIRKMEIPTPSIREQLCVVEKLDKISSIIIQRQQELDKLDELIKARFVEMFGAQESEKKQLIELIQEGAGLSYGIVVPGDNVEGGIPMVRPSDFKNGSLNLDNVYKVASDIECKYKKTRLNGDEILVQVIGQPGQVMLSDERCKGMNVTRNLAVIRIDKNKADKLFISHYLTTEDAQRFMFGSTNQSTLKQLPLNKLKELPIPLVPVSEQERFAMFVKQVDKSKVVVQTALDKAQLLFDSLMQEYFG